MSSMRYSCSLLSSMFVQCFEENVVVYITNTTYLLLLSLLYFDLFELVHLVSLTFMRI